MPEYKPSTTSGPTATLASYQPLTMLEPSHRAVSPIRGGAKVTMMSYRAETWVGQTTATMSRWMRADEHKPRRPDPYRTLIWMELPAVDDAAPGWGPAEVQRLQGRGRAGAWAYHIFRLRLSLRWYVCGFWMAAFYSEGTGLLLCVTTE